MNIAMFDSGVGGLSVLREARTLLPAADFIYLADQAFAPYGERTLGEVQKRAEAITATLVEHGAEMVVIACHTASAAALHHLRKLYPTTPFVGIEPAVKPAASQSQSRTIGVLATTATFSAEMFRNVVDRYAVGTGVIARPCPGLADLIESGAPQPLVDAALRDHLRPMTERAVDRIVLACTHYSFIRERIAELTGVEVIDPAPAVARQVARVAQTAGLLGGGSTTTYLTTGPTGHLAERLEALLGDQRPVQAVTVG